jgi:phosphoglycerate-specific signal transduction histidine kinase
MAGDHTQGEEAKKLKSAHHTTSGQHYLAAIAVALLGPFSGDKRINTKLGMDISVLVSRSAKRVVVTPGSLEWKSSS